ncbi:hypothetical protein [Streptomyces prunicolor]|uniref:Uncharacterized protein n=1 Tax=Streptomyces prunicolor TaxID=67348 RepID=A0ABU4F4F4_9ACTN|nr:hypothetical protein [Streptomyces prunicolor]MCX5234873.1 hypothetical protein [Streptomyces prunicolor]MDV7214868.1 hypothetical protein [Streptomyces prunicolor]
MLLSHVRTAAFVASVAAVSGFTVDAPVRVHGIQAPETRTVAYFSYEPLAAANPVSDLPASARRQLAAQDDVVVPRTGTPDGYKLRRGTASTDYVYKSADVYAIEASCDPSTCHPVQQVKLAIKEYVRGRTSKNWEITFYGSRETGSSHFNMDYTYECGVNLSHAPDETCSTWKHDGAQGHGSGVAVNKQKIVKNFGRTPVVTKFPMTNLLVTFADGSEAKGDDGKPGEKFRGWDVCVTNTTTKLCHSTGDGS